MIDDDPIPIARSQTRSDDEIRVRRLSPKLAGDLAAQRPPVHRLGLTASAQDRQNENGGDVKEWADAQLGPTIRQNADRRRSSAARSMTGR